MYPVLPPPVAPLQPPVALPRPPFFPPAASPSGSASRPLGLDGLTLQGALRPVEAVGQRALDGGHALLDRVLFYVLAEFRLLTARFLPAPRLQPLPVVPQGGVPPLPPGLAVTAAALTGAADPSAALQRAIDQAAAAGGGVVQLPAGRFTLSRTVSLASGVHLVGVPGQTVLVGGAAAPLFKVHGTQDASLRGLVLDGGGRALNMVRGDSSQRIGIYGCELFGTSSNGAYGAGTAIMFDADVTDARVIGNVIHDLGSPGDTLSAAMVIGWGSSRAVVTDNRMYNLPRQGFNAHNGCTDLYIARNDISGMTAEERLSIELWNGCSGIVEENHVSSWISFDSSSGTIRNNEVDGRRDSRKNWLGIELAGCTGVTVQGNRVQNVSLGLSIDRSRGNLISNNSFAGVDTGVQGYGAKAPADHNTLAGNTFSGTGQGGDMSRGIFLNQACDDWVLQGNTVQGFRQPLSVYASNAPTQR